MVKILSIDQSLSNTGYSIFFNNNLKVCDSFKIKVKDVKCNVCSAERLYKIKQFLINLIDKYGIFDYVILEGYSFSKNSQALTGLYELGGMIRMLCYEYNIRYVVIPPSLAKKYLNMKEKFKEGKQSGMTNKQITFTAIKNKFNKWDFKDDDSADSYLFGYILKEYFRWIQRPHLFNKVETEVFIQLSEQIEKVTNCKGNHYKLLKIKS